MNFRRKMLFSLRTQPNLIRDIIHNRIDEIRQLLKESPAKCVFSDSSRRTPLHLACALGRTEIVQLFLQHECFTVNYRDADLVTPLHRACRNNHHHTVSQLLKYNADVNARSRMHVTPLHVCCSFDAIECAHLIVASVHNINATDSNGYTALHHAVYRSCLPIIQLLLEHGASPDVQDKHGQRPIHYAAVANSPAAIQMLVQAGSDVNVRNKDLLTPLHMAVVYKSQNAFLALVELNANLEAQDIDGNMPSHWAAFICCEAIFETIMARVSVTSPNLDGMTPMHYACGSSQSNDIVIKMLKAGLSVDILNKFRRTPLHYAALKGCDRIAMELIAHGANINFFDEEFETPLHKAVSNMHHSMVALLIRNGATLDVANKSGFTPLHYAVSAGLSSNCALLINAGANPFIQDAAGRSAHYHAVHKGSLDCFVCLLNSPHYLTSLSNSAPDQQELSVFPQFDAFSRSLLHYAAASNTCSHEFIEVLLLHRRLNAQECKISPDVVVALEEAFGQFNINHRDEYGRTPLHYICLREVDIESDVAFIVDLMIKSGADGSLMDNENRLPFHYAVANNYSTILDHLFNPKWMTRRIDFDRFFLRNCPLKTAAFHGNSAAITKLLNYGFRNYEKAIEIATRRNNWNCVLKLKQFINRGKFHDLAMLTVKNGQTNGFRIFLACPNLDLPTLWFRAAISPLDSTCLELLIEKGFDIQTCDLKGRNALFYAVIVGNMESARLLLVSGIRLVRDYIGKTVFHLMATTGNVEMLCMFHSLSHNNGFYGHMSTYLLAKDDDGFSPMQVACVKKQQAILEYYVTSLNKGFEQKLLFFAGFTSNFTFVEYVYKKYGSSFANLTGPNDRTLLHYAAMSKQPNLQLLKFLCEILRVDTNVRDAHGFTPLLLAANVGNDSSVDYLMKCTDSDTMAVDNENNTVLHLASLSGNANAALTVIRISKNLNLLDMLIASENEAKQTALHLAAKKSLNEVMYELICNGASVNDADDNGYTPLMYCARDPFAALCVEMLVSILEMELLKKQSNEDMDNSVASCFSDNNTNQRTSVASSTFHQSLNSMIDRRHRSLTGRFSITSSVCDNSDFSRITSKGSLNDGPFRIEEKSNEEQSDGSFQNQCNSLSDGNADLPASSNNQTLTPKLAATKLHEKDHEDELHLNNPDNFVDSDSELF